MSTAFSSQADMPVLTGMNVVHNSATIAHASNHCTIVAQFLTLSIPLCYNREEQDNPDAYRMLSSLLYGSDARRIKQRIVLRTGRKKQCGCSSNDYGDCPDFNCPQVPRKEKKLPC